MIAQLRGTVAASTLDVVVLDVAGVGYRIHVAPGTPTAGPGEELTLYTHLAVREDALTLYGFADPSSRDLFETMLSVTGVGPKVALAALGALGAEGLRHAVVTEDVAALTVVPGVGKKGAQRVILELGEKLGALAAPSAPASDGGAGGTDPRTEVRQALAALGYDPGEVEAAMNSLPTDADAESLLRTALQALGRS